MVFILSGDYASSFSDDGSRSDSSTVSISSDFTKHRRRRTNTSESRKPVTPPVLSMYGKLSLTDFFNTVYDYFIVDYLGSPNGNCETLSEYLVEDLLRVFNAKGEWNFSYSKMKSELMDYYKEHSIV